MSTKVATSKETNAVVEGLTSLLADSYQLMAQTHLAHWNVVGTDFFTLHTAFQTQYEDLFTAVDDLAEQLRQLDVFAPGGLKRLAGMSGIEEMDDVLSAKEYVANLIIANEHLVGNAIKARVAAADAGDAETEDLIISRIQVHNKTLWFLKSYLK